MHTLEYENERHYDVEKYLKTRSLELDNVQSFFPCVVSNVDTIKTNKWSSIKLKSRLINITNYNPDNLEGTITNDGEEYTVPFHIKCTPLLEPLSIHRNEYLSYKHHHWLPGQHYNVSNSVNKINCLNNTAYTDATCSVLLAKLREEDLTLHYGKVYGLYNGIISDYEEDITEDYSIIKDKKWLKKCKVSKIYNKLHKNAEDYFPNLKKCDLDDFAVEMDLNNEPDDDDDEDIKYTVTHPKVPVQVVIMEKCDITLDELLKALIERVRLYTQFRALYRIRKDIFSKKLCAWIFQVSAALAIANREIDFVHNDLHVQNIMGRKTEQEYIFYRQGDRTYKVPTYGYIMQIIDYGRSTYKIDGVTYFGDVFHEDGDAGGQYTLPDDEKYGSKKSVNPNPAFDLARLACSFVEDLDNRLWPTQEHLREFDSGKLLLSWTVDDRGNSLMDIEGFDLYVHIAKCFRRNKPYKQISNDVFKCFLTELDTSCQTVYLLDT